MPEDTTLCIRQEAPIEGKYLIRLALKRPDQPDLEAEAQIKFSLTPQDRAELRWYLEDYLQNAESAEEVHVGQIEAIMVQRGEELYTKVLTANQNTQAIWFAVREKLADLRIEIKTGIAEAASIPWELMRDPQSDSAIALRVKAFVRVQSNPNISFVSVPAIGDGRVRLLYVVCRPSGPQDVSLRAVANRLLQGLGDNRDRFDITALRPPTYEQLQHELQDAKAAGRPYHIVHFDGHGIYADLSKTVSAGWLAQLSRIALGGKQSGKHGYLIFEQPGSEDKVRPVSGKEIGQLLHDNGVPVLVLNACQSAMHEATKKPTEAETVHDEVRAIGSLSQAVVDEGIPAVLGMRYSVFVVTAAQYIGELYGALAKGRSFGQAATEARKHLHNNPDRWIRLEPRPLQDWFVPVVYEAKSLTLLPEDKPLELKPRVIDPVQINSVLLRYVPDHGFVGRDETLLMLDRAFDSESVVLLHAYAGQGKTTTAVEFARWYAQTGGLGQQPLVVLSSFESHTDLDDVLNQIGLPFVRMFEANGIEWHAINETEKRQEQILQVLRQIPVLWIWNNVEPVAGFPEGNESAWTSDEQQQLADFLKQIKLDSATKVKILLTSRRDEKKWLGGIPHRVKMPPMLPSDAANLAMRLGDERKIKRAELANWQPLLKYCGGNPLTLRVIVGQAVKEGLRKREQIEKFVEAIRAGEKQIEDADEAEGRDKSLGASLDYGFRNAFEDDELPIIALLHLFQGTVEVAALLLMGKTVEHALPELKGKSKEYLTSLLERASETGLLTHLGSTYFTIHPALPWFLRQLYEKHYDGMEGRSSGEAGLRAWVEAIGALGSYYHDQSGEGNQSVIDTLRLEEDNLLHARSLARRHGWWIRIISAMQGLYELYGFHGRKAEWSRLVAEIVPDFCTDNDEPVPGREDAYSFVMEYRVAQAKDYEHNLPRAAALQAKVVAWERKRAATSLALPEDAPLDDRQRHRIRSLAMSTGTLGQILSEQGSSGCVESYEETIRLLRRIKDVAAEAIAHFNLGHAYKDIDDIRDLDAAEAAYRHSLDLRDPKDILSRSQCIQQIGMVHHERLNEALRQGEPEETLLQHAQAAEKHYLQALKLCPVNAIADLGPCHNQLGILHAEVGQPELAREHFEKVVQLAEQAGDRYHAGQTRENMALMYANTSEREENLSRKKDLLLRAQAYAKAALRDYQSFDGRAATNEAKVQRLLDRIQKDLDGLPQ